jgi:uncharacterized protein YkwD
VSSPVLTGRPAHPRASQPGSPGSPGPRGGPPRRARYLLGVPPLVAALVAGGLYLTRAPAPPPSRSAIALTSRSPDTSLSQGAAPDTSLSAGACDSAAAGSCTEQPIHVSTARVPRSPASTRVSRTAASPPASPSASPLAASRSASATSPAHATSPAPAQQGTPAAQVLALINQARSAAGLPPLTVTAGLDASASAHNLRMADGCGLTHECPGEPAIGARETAAGVGWTAAGENIGEGGPVPDTTAATAQMAVTLTQDMLDEQPPDDGHRLNILSSTFTHIGIAVYRDTSGTVWLTQDFSN